MEDFRRHGGIPAGSVNVDVSATSPLYRTPLKKTSSLILCSTEGSPSTPPPASAYHIPAVVEGSRGSSRSGTAAAAAAEMVGFRTPPPPIAHETAATDMAREDSPFSHRLFHATTPHQHGSTAGTSLSPFHNMHCRTGSTSSRAGLLQGGGGGGGSLLRHTPPAKDRFISQRDDDSSRGVGVPGTGVGAGPGGPHPNPTHASNIAHFLLTTDDPVTPMLLSQPQPAVGGAGGGGGGPMATGLGWGTPHRLAGGTTPRRGGSLASAGNSGSRFGASPSPARSLFGGSEPRGQAGSLPRTALNSLFNSPSRFESEVGTDAGMDEDGADDPFLASTFGGGSSIGSSASRLIGSGGLLDNSGNGGLPKASHPAGSHSGAANMLVNVEPYNARLARSLFSDVTQTSVLRHTSGGGGGGVHHQSSQHARHEDGRDIDASPRSPPPAPLAAASPLAKDKGRQRQWSCHEDENENEEEGAAAAASSQGTCGGNPGGMRRVSSQALASRSHSRSSLDVTAVLGARRGDVGGGDGVSVGRNENRFGKGSEGVRQTGMRSPQQHFFPDDEDDEDGNEEERSGHAAYQLRYGGGSGPSPSAASVLSYAGNDAARFDQSPAVVFEQNKANNFVSRGFRHISSTPDRILDAARLVDEFYYNVLDCSRYNVVAVALEAALYLWEWSTESISTLPPENSFISGVKWAPDGIRLASSNEEGDVIVWDTRTSKDEAVFTVHKERVCALAWNATGNILASGSKDASIVLNDTRSQTPALELPKGVGHSKEVCGLQWSLQDLYLASGGDDNKLLVWDSRRLDSPLHTLTQHSSAVKALAWHPVQPHLLVSGGGIEDKMLRFWSADTGECIRQAHTSSQVCGVAWHHSGTELVSCHGFPHHQITLWRYPSLNRVVDLCGHRSRVLHLCLSAGGETVISAASDETVRFWSCFPPAPPVEEEEEGEEEEAQNR